MKNIFSIMILLGMWGSAVSFATEKITLPKDVAQFQERRESCDHFRGEEAYDEERRKFLLKQLKATCKGTDRKLEKLKKKYKLNQRIMLFLNAYEAKIEA